MSWTLERYLQEAGIGDIPEWASKVIVNINDDPELIPFHHQVTGLSQAAYWERFGLYDDTGTGKSLISQGYVAYQSGLGNKVVGIMPPILLAQYNETIRGNLKGIDDYLDIQVFNQTPKKRADLMGKWRATDTWPDLLLMSYQMFLKHWRELQFDYPVLIADEAQALKNPGSKIHAAVYTYIGGRSLDETNFLPMTGTPIHNGLKDAYGLIRLITPDRYSSWDNFAMLHCVFNPNVKYEQIMAYKNHEHLYHGLYLQARRVLKSEVLDMPEKLVSKVPVWLDAKHKKLYDTLARERVLEMGDEIIDAIHQSSLRMKLMQLVSTPEDFSEDKVKNQWLSAVDEVVDTVGPNTNKIIIFGHFNKTLEKLFHHYKEFNPAIIYGGSLCKDSTKEKLKFQTDDTCRMLIAQPKSAGAGLDFQRVCSNVLFAEPTGVPGDVQQCSDRVYRAGQDETVNIYFLEVIDTSYSRILEQMLHKEGEANIVYRDNKELLRDLIGKAA